MISCRSGQCHVRSQAQANRVAIKCANPVAVFATAQHRLAVFAGTDQEVAIICFVAAYMSCDEAGPMRACDAQPQETSICVFEIQQCPQGISATANQTSIARALPPARCVLTIAKSTQSRQLWLRYCTVSPLP